MPDPISSNATSYDPRNYTPGEGPDAISLPPDEPNASVDVDANVPPYLQADDGANAEAVDKLASKHQPAQPPQPRHERTDGDGTIKRDGAGVRVDPHVTHKWTTTTPKEETTATLSGVGATVGLPAQNLDGSKGARIAVSASLFQDVGTVSDRSGNEGTFGTGIGVGLDVSSGTRDADADGVPEHCVRAEFGVLIVGACGEGDTASERIKNALRSFGRALVQ